MDRTSKYRRIVIKAGSNVLTRDDGRPDTTRISSLVDQIARLHRAGIEVILVSSGAVASGRRVMERSLLSAKVYISFCTTSVSVPMERRKRSVYSRRGVRSSPKA